MKILLTGFEPFDERGTNASMEIVNAYQPKDGTVHVSKRILPVVWEHEPFLQVFKDHLGVDLILMCGEAGNRSNVSLEGIALNVKIASISDNNGIRMNGEPIDENGPVAYKTRIDVASLERKLGKTNVRQSYHAGVFICNMSYYLANKFVEERGLPTRVLFVHFPYLEEQSFPLGEATELLDEIIAAIERDM